MPSESPRLLRTPRHPVRARPFILTGAIALLALAGAALWALRANMLVRLSPTAAVGLEILAAAIVVFATLALLMTMLFGLPGARRARNGR